jgi:hypothetical protein
VKTKGPHGRVAAAIGPSIETRLKFTPVGQSLHQYPLPYMTITFWFRRDYNVTSVSAKYTTILNGPGWYLDFCKPNYDSSANKLIIRCGLQDASGLCEKHLPTPQNQWMHIGLLFDYHRPTAKIKLYIDGKYDSTITANAGHSSWVDPKGWIPTDTDPILIGNGYNSRTYPVSPYSLCGLRVYKQLMKQEDIPYTMYY